MFTDWRLNSKMSIIPKVVYRLNAFFVKILIAFFYRNRKIHAKLQMKYSGIFNSHKNLTKKKKKR